MAENTQTPELWSKPPLIMLESVLLFPDESVKEFLPRRAVEQIAASVLDELEQRGIDPATVIFISQYAVNEAFERSRQIVQDMMSSSHLRSEPAAPDKSDAELEAEKSEWHLLPDDQAEPFSFERGYEYTPRYGDDILPDERIVFDDFTDDSFEQHLADLHRSVEHARADERGEVAINISYSTADQLASFSDFALPRADEAVAYEFQPNMVGELLVVDPAKLHSVDSDDALVLGESQIGDALVCSFSADIQDVLAADFFDNSDKANLRRAIEDDARINEARIEELQMQPVDPVNTDLVVMAAVNAELGARLQLRASLLREIHSLSDNSGANDG